MGKWHSIQKSFGYAFQGVRTAVKREPNIRIHIIFALLALLLAAFLDFSYIEWIILFLTIFFVIMLELINTAMEALVNLVSPEIKDEAKVAKDVAASAVLFAAIISIVVGIVLFVPKIMR